MGSLLVLAVCAAASEECVDVAPVWAGHPVGFALLTHGDRQFVAYYDRDRQMTVAVRRLDEREWHRVVLPERLGWDSHNYVTLAVDKPGFLHLSGNMHGRPLVYFRSRTPLDVDTFERAPMVGAREDHVTYPEFIHGPHDELVFTYRDGSSGNGDQIYNVYDPNAKTWKRLLDTPLTSGEGHMNAYFDGPVKGPDGRYHACWVWRDNPGCESNHDPCYARSTDLVHWETAAGTPLELPITLAAADVVDHVPPGAGIINTSIKMGFDSRQRPIVSYHKFDAKGLTQAYSARFEDGTWKVYQTSDWDYRWDFRGFGAIPVEIRLSGVRPGGHDTLEQSFAHIKHGSGMWILDEATLKPLRTIRASEAADVDTGLDAARFVPQRAGDLGQSAEPGAHYELRWETWPANRDRPREGEPPPPSMLRVVKLRGDCAPMKGE